MRKHFVRSLLASLALFSAASCTKRDPTPRTSAPAQVLRLSQRNEPGDLDPATITIPDDLFVIRALSEGLVVPDPAGGQRPAAAERWEISPDRLTYTFFLRPGIRWSNGEPVTAQDFVESYQRALAPATASPKVALFYPVKNARAFFTGEIRDFKDVGFRAVDARTLAITLARLDPAFLAYAASGPWIPVNPRVVARHGRDWTRPGNFVGNGAFVLTEWKSHQRIAVRKNPHYVDAARVKLEEIQFIAFDNGEAEDRAYRAGQVDVTMAVPVSKLKPYASERPGEFHRRPLAETRSLAFNTERPPLNDARVRRALARVIDREKITARVTFSGEPASDWLPPALLTPTGQAELSRTPAPSPADVKLAAEEARQWLAAAGFAGGKGFPRLEVSCWSSSQVPTLEAIQSLWKTELGIDVAIATREAKVHLAALRAGSYDIGFITTIPDVADPVSILAELVTGAADNYAQWSSAAYDALIDRAQETERQSEQRALLSQAEALIATEAPIAPLYYNMKNWLMSPRVQGWEEDAFWTRSYTGISMAP